MNDFMKQLENNWRTIYIVLPVLMFVFFALCPAFDLLGKTTANGLKIVFDGKGLGLSRLLTVLLVLVPVCGLLLQFFTINALAKFQAKLNLIWTATALALIILLAIALPTGVSFAWGSYLYFLLAAAGVAFEYIGQKADK